MALRDPSQYHSLPLTYLTEYSIYKYLATGVNMDFLKKKMKELLDDDDKPKDKPTGEPQSP